MKPICAIILLLLITTPAAFAASLISGEQIPVGTDNGQGPLATPGIMSLPLGAVNVFGNERADLFLATTKFGAQPGLWLYRWIETKDNSVPVFKRERKIAHPFKAPYPPSGFIVESRAGDIFGVWIQGKTLVWTTFDKNTWAFIETHRLPLNGIPRGPESIGILENEDGTWQVYLSIGDGTPYKTYEGSGRSPDYQPYKGNGIWHGGMPYSALYLTRVSADGTQQLDTSTRISKNDRDVRFSMRRIAPTPSNGGSSVAVFTGSAMGELHYYNLLNQSWESRMMARGKDHITLRHPTIYATPIIYPNPTDNEIDLLVGGEGGVYFYRKEGMIRTEIESSTSSFSGIRYDKFTPILRDPVPALEADAKLYGGTLPVPNVVDWDGDGALDIVAGNSEGLVLFMKNSGTNEAPAFLPGEPLYAGDEKIHIQPGYRLDIQGPGEARWGYTCPTVVDWNNDGTLDILMSDSTARHTVYLNTGTPKAPKLAIGRPLYYEGLEMYGTWRVKPGIAKMNGRMAYVALDDEDQFHLYWKVDDYNVTDGGKLHLENGDPIGANFLQAGGSGRLKITLYDWDNDGATDLLVGTPRHGSVPNPETGLPQSLGLPGSSVLLLKNTGTDAAPKFTFPKLLTFKGQPIFFGQHACSPSPAPFQGHKQADLIVSEEDGRFNYFKREDIEFKDLKHIDPASIPKRK
ncbi:MAG: hypothetical protein COA73_15520 [Candidatus Hydrogenedentota bacterium]|nr:MAG: hypothetical protein COA73_15520 [Candidatus Hydrogenedentota bacterium]